MIKVPYFRTSLYFVFIHIFPTIALFFFLPLRHKGCEAWGEGLRYETDGDAGRLAQGCKFWILVSLRVFRAKRRYFKPPRSRLGFREETQNYAKRNRSQIFFFLFFFFLKRSLLGVKICLSHAQIGLLQGSPKALTTPRWSPLGIKFKISDEHPCLFHMGVPPLDVKILFQTDLPLNTDNS